MPVTETTTLTIVCDNPDCPGNSLDPGSRDGWVFVTSEVYGQSTQQHVFCSAGCVSRAAAAAEAGQTFSQPQPQ